MVAASIWSLIIPSIEESSDMGRLSFIPALVGFLVGVGFLLILDIVIPHLHISSKSPEGPKSSIKRTTMLIFAVTLHNIPEGMAVGVVLAEVYYGHSLMTMTGALALCIGIAIQNMPEGAIVSTPLVAAGENRKKSFLYGVLSGLVEPITAGITFLIAGLVQGILPYILSFAAGAMMYVVVEELIPESQEGEHSNIGTIGVAIGFIIMMILDVALG